MKKFVCILLTMMLMLGCAGAMAETYGDFTYSVTDGKVTITAYTGSAAEVSIPSSIDGKQVTEIGDSAFKDKITLTKVTIPSGVERIGNRAFYGTNIKSLTDLPDSLQEIGMYSFSYNGSLKQVIIPASVTSIGTYAFVMCPELMYVEFKSENPDQIMMGSTFDYDKKLQITVPAGKRDAYIDEFHDAYYGDNWKALVLPEGLKYTVDETAGTVKITDYTGTDSALVIPDKIHSYPVTYIEESAFAGCTSLKSVVIPEGVESIGMCAFQSCTGLKSITTPNSLKNINDNVFADCTGLTSVTIPGGVTSIRKQMFINCTGLESVIISDGVTSIGIAAFSGCSSLKDVKISSSVKSIGSRAFAICTSLTSIEIPEGVESVEDAFADCTGLTSVKLPDSLKHIGSGMFYRCENLTSLTIPESVESIGYGAFEYCPKLASLTFKGKTPPAISWGLCSYNNDHGSLEEINVPKGSEEAYLEAFMKENPNGDWARLLGIQDQPEEIAGAAADLPKTGDASMLGAWIALLGVASVGMKLRRKA